MGGPGNLSFVPTPPTIQALLAARLDRLEEEEERAVLQRAAVVGKVFWWGAVEELSPREARTQVGSRLQALVRRELIRPEESPFSGEDAFRFRHLLIRDAAYESMPKVLRADLHERFADWLERVAGERIDEYEEILGHHLEQAYRRRAELGPIDQRSGQLAGRAAERLASAGRRALARSDMPAAATLLARSAHLMVDRGIRGAVLLDLSDALVETGQLARAEEVLDQVVKEARVARDRGLEVRTSVRRMRVRMNTQPGGWVEEARRLASAALEALGESGEDSARSDACELEAASYWLTCNFGPATDMLERALGHARRAGNRRGELRILAWLAAAALFGPTPVEDAIARCRQILKGAADDLMLDASCSLRTAGLEAMRGQFGQAWTLIDRWRSLLTDLGHSFFLAHGTDVVAEVAMLSGDPARAEKELRRSYAALEGMGERSSLSTQAALLGEAIYRQGRYEEAAEFSRLSEEKAAKEDAFSQTLWRSVLAKCLARGGEVGAAEALSRYGVALMERTDAIAIHADALMDLGEVMTLASRPDEAAEAVRQAIGLYEHKGNTVMIDRGRRLLAGLGAHRLLGGLDR